MKKSIAQLLSFSLCLLAGCGGGGSTVGAPAANVPVPSGQCTVASENQALLGYLQDEYYWYQDIPADLDPASFASPSELLNAAKAPQDRFSFIISVDQFDAIFNDANFVGMGFSQRVADDEQSLEIRYVYDNGAAFDAGLKRGDKITAINGVGTPVLISNVKAGATTWTSIFGAGVVGNAVNMTVTRAVGESFSNDYIKSIVDTNTVLASQMIQTLDKAVAYLVFDQFIARSAADLNAAFSQFSTAGAQELILDLRYNGGGFVNIANQLSSQIGGNNVADQIFTSFIHNDKHSDRNSSLAFALGAGVDRLNLDRVVVLMSPSTCSASELVINALSPFIDVVTVGETSCGKPVGMNTAQICDDMVFAINFETVNGVGAGGYFNGITAECFAQDQVVADWGNIEDPLLREGLFYLDNNRCFSQNRAPLSLKQGSPLNQVDFSKGPWAAKNVY
jgi:carboxyl-terminal processing protease